MEEKERAIQSLESKENEQLKEQLIALEQQRKELMLRQEAYNQQQLDFITRKNTFAAQQFDLADKLTDYNAQVKLFNENLDKLETEKHYKPQYNHYDIYVYSLNHTLYEVRKKYGICKSTYYNIKNEYENKKSKKSLDNS